MYAVGKRGKKEIINMEKKKTQNQRQRKTLFWQNSSSCSFDFEGVLEFHMTSVVIIFKLCKTIRGKIKLCTSVQ